MTMKKHILFFSILTICTSIAAAQQFQLPNPGFEQWDGGYDSEPTHWNTFESSDGSYSSLASSNHHYRRSGHRPGGSGNYFLTIYTKSIVGVKANGNMTTGRIHAGSMSASSSDNYNYTQRSNSAFCQPFTATPDSMYVWVSFYAGSSNSTAQVEAIIHGDIDFKAPNDVGNTSKYKGRAVAQTTRTTSSASQRQWKQLKVPFVYNGSADAAYILVNMTTNNIPGSGDKNDSLSIDDIEFIYSAWLTDIRVDGNTIENFEKGRLNYAIHVDDIAAIGTSNVDFTTEVPDATVETSVSEIDDTTKVIRLAVTAEDGSTQRTYRITATCGTPGDPLDISNAEPAFPVVYPNPANNQITIDRDCTIYLTDLKGHVVMHRKCLASEPIGIGHLPRGVYFVNIEGTKIVKKLIIK